MVAEAWFESTAEMLAFTTDTLARAPGIVRTEPLQILEMVDLHVRLGEESVSAPVP